MNLKDKCLKVICISIPPSIDVPTKNTRFKKKLIR